MPCENDQMKQAILALISSFFVAILVGYLILRTQKLHNRYSSDHNLSGVQKFHIKAVPRIGGIAIIVGAFVALILVSDRESIYQKFGLNFLLATAPVFITGLIEDLTKKISARTRLLSAFISSLGAGYLFNCWLVDIQFMGLEHLLAIPIISILFTCFALAGVTNAFNLIDGYNGLASMVGIIVLTTIAYVSYRVDDYFLLFICCLFTGAIMGFLFWNYPKGLFFLGDGGAYLIGFWVALCSLLLVTRNHEVSKWFPVLLCIYPIFETLFTIYRRVILHKQGASQPDALHLHQIIYRRILRGSFNQKKEINIVIRNSMTSPYLWGLTLMATLPAIIFWSNKVALQIFIVIFVITYCWLYRAIVRFQVPKFLFFFGEKKHIT